MSNDLIVVVDFDKTILAIIPVIVEETLSEPLGTSRALQRRVVRSHQDYLKRQWIGLRQVNVHGSAGAA